MSKPPRIYLSKPDVGARERELLLDAFDSNWIAPLGPHVDAFEEEMARAIGVGHAAALSSGTAALHLALQLCGVRPGDEVLVSTLTFAATANAIVYCNAQPVFIDSDPQSWNIDPETLATELAACARRNKMPRAVLAVDLYGQCADYETLQPICARFGVPLIEDAAESLGARHKGRMAGTFGFCAALSFNGNKIITTSGGGMLVSDDGALIERARFLATQARDPAPHYEHSCIGYNYRMSNLLAALGRGQLASLAEKVQKKRAIRARYEKALRGVPGLAWMPRAPRQEPNDWLSVVLIDAGRFGATPERVRLALAERNIECRPLWKPMHMQPVFANCRRRGGEVAADLFARGVCLPSGASLTQEEQARVIDALVASRH